LIDLSPYGWQGWALGPYRRSTSRVLHSPNGQHYTQQEICDLSRLVLDNDYLKARVEALEAVLRHPSMKGRMELLSAVADFLVGLGGFLDQPSALVGKPVNRLDWTQILDALHAHKAAPDTTIQQAVPIRLRHVTKRPDR